MDAGGGKLGNNLQDKKYTKIKKIIYMTLFLVDRANACQNFDDY